MFRFIRKLLERNPLSVCVVSTPDRFRTHGFGYNGLPINKAHVREWTLEELSNFLVSSGFKINYQGYTRSNNFDENKQTIYLEFELEDFGQFCHKAKIPFRSSHHCIITTEHPDLGKTGGIGSYYKELENITQDYKILKIFIGDFFANIKDQGNEWIFPHTFFSNEEVLKILNDDTGHFGDISLYVLEQVLYLYSNINLVEFQEYLGIGYRIIQAQKACLIPNIVSKAVCHGSQIYLTNAHKKILEMENISIAYREKYVVENSDITVFPTFFLRKQYEINGYDLNREWVIDLRYPYDYGSAPQVGQIVGNIDTICFFGKRSTMKGFDNFLKCILKLIKKNIVGKDKQINNIVILGSKVPGADDYAKEIEEISKYVDVFEHDLPRQDALNLLAQSRNCTIVIAPYTADNHPVSILELIGLKIPFITYKAGGIPELVPEKFHENIISLPTVVNLVEKIIEYLSLTPKQKAYIVENCFLLAKGDQDFINKLNHDLNTIKYKDFSRKRLGHFIDPNLVSVVVPTYNTDLGQIKELCIGINRQSYQPKEVIFVNDGSENGYETKLNEILSLNLKPKFRIITQENKGLSGARNTGFSNAKTKYIISHDSDDVLAENSIQVLVEYMERNENIDIATTYLRSFFENENFEEKNINSYEYHPSFQSIAYGIYEDTNNYGSSFAIFRKKVFDETGGWDTFDKSTFEDWAYYFRLTQLGYKIGVIPKVLYLYRIRANSMLRTYNKLLGRYRLSRNIGFLDKFERNIYLALIDDHTRTRRIVDQQKNQILMLLAEHNSFASRVARGIRNRIKRIPIIYWFLGKLKSYFSQNK